MTHTQDVYWRTRARAAYYLWAALRGHALPGNDPITGMPRKSTDETCRAEGRAAYKALYRVTRDRANSIRLYPTKAL